MKRKLLYIFVMVGIFTSYSNAQNSTLEWAHSFGTSGWEHGNSITTTTFGNVYVTGTFYDTLDFDPGPGISNLISNGLRDIFIQKLDAAGNLIWAKSLGANYADNGYSVTSDSHENVYITGDFHFTVDFDPGIGVCNLTSIGQTPSAPRPNVFVLKLDSSGNFIWAKCMQGLGGSTGNCITTDINDNVYLTGNFYDTADFNPNSGVTNLISNGSTDIFVQKLNSSGNLLWAKSMGGLWYDKGE